MATATNSGAITWEAAPQTAIDGNADATHIGLWTALTNGNFLGGEAIGTDLSALILGEKYSIAASGLTITVPNTDYTSAGGQRVVGGMVSTIIYVSVHSADPGGTGANEITDLARVSIAAGATGWTIA